jgi:hypothetical protein
MDFARDTTDHAVYMEDGVIGAQGATEHIFDERPTPGVRRFPKHEPVNGSGRVMGGWLSFSLSPGRRHASCQRLNVTPSRLVTDSTPRGIRTAGPYRRRDC